MPGLVIHVGVALVALLLYFDDRNRKYVLLLLPFAVLPDLDHFAPLYAPREMLHNVFLLVPPLAIALYGLKTKNNVVYSLSLIHISEPTRLLSISYAVFCLKKK